MPTCTKQSGNYCPLALSTWASLTFMFCSSTAVAQQSSSSSVGRASATVIEPLSITAKEDMRFAIGRASGQSRIASEAGLFEIRSPGAYEFSLSIQPDVLATSPTSGGGLIIDAIEARGSNWLAGSEWLGPDGASTVRFSGRIRAPEGANGDKYTGHVLVNLAYH